MRRYRVVQRPGGGFLGAGSALLVRAPGSWPQYRIDTWNPVQMKEPRKGFLLMTHTEVPGGKIYHDPAGRFDGPYVLWYNHGPFRSLKAAQLEFKEGKRVGTVTYWDKHGRVVEQFNEQSESKTSSPWWDGIQDQVPEDGVYTEVGGMTGGNGNSLVLVNKQWEYRGGRVVAESPPFPWRMPTDGFWRVHRGRMVHLPGLDKSSYFLDGRPLHDGDMLRLTLEGRGSKRVQYKLAGRNATDPSLTFLDADAKEEIAAGQTERFLDVRGSLAWP